MTPVGINADNSLLSGSGPRVVKDPRRWTIFVHIDGESLFHSRAAIAIPPLPRLPAIRPTLASGPFSHPSTTERHRQIIPREVRIP